MPSTNHYKVNAVFDVIWGSILAIAGLILSKILFYQFPRLDQHKNKNPETMAIKSYPSLSIIIPARNEEENLNLLLEDLKRQSFSSFEIICVDDGSTDTTATVALSYQTKLIQIEEKPAGWNGKSYACYKGAKLATNDVLLFLDADVRLEEDALKRLLITYQDKKPCISVLPFHQTIKNYEQFSFFFNLVQLAGNGTTLKKPLDIGLFGPVILIQKDDYHKSGGHEAVKNSIVDDMSFGQHLKKLNIPFSLYLGDPSISYRMYRGGLQSLVQGWTKNMASGAKLLPPRLTLGLFIWITALLSVCINLIKHGLLLNLPLFLIYLWIYVIYAIVLRNLSQKIAQFKGWTSKFFIVPLSFFLLVFCHSLFKSLLNIDVIWKGRKMRTGQE